ncbi:MAG: chemotaxis protein CheD, partial [Fibrobacterales bacterium]
IIEYPTLLQGQVFYTRKTHRIQTILGSCVSLFIHCSIPKFAIVCHAVYPTRKNNSDVRYVDGAIHRMLHELKKAGIPLSHCTVKLFGGAYTPGNNSSYEHSIGYQNAEVAQKVLSEANVIIDTHDVGGTQGRKLIFCTESGKVYLKKIKREIGNGSK